MGLAAPNGDAFESVAEGDEPACSEVETVRLARFNFGRSFGAAGEVGADASGTGAGGGASGRILERH